MVADTRRTSAAQVVLPLLRTCGEEAWNACARLQVAALSACPSGLMVCLRLRRLVVNPVLQARYL